jgi:hypothetical protein
MRLKIVEIEATAEELKASNSFADALSNQLRNIFCPPFHVNIEDDDVEEGD